MIRNQRPDDLEGLRQFKAEFFKALGHPMRILILEILRSGPCSVGKLAETVGAPESSISQQLAVLRSRGIVVTERRGTTVIYRVRDIQLFDLLDSARPPHLQRQPVGRHRHAPPGRIRVSDGRRSLRQGRARNRNGAARRSRSPVRCSTVGR